MNEDLETVLEALRFAPDAERREAMDAARRLADAPRWSPPSHEDD